MACLSGSIRHCKRRPVTLVVGTCPGYPLQYPLLSSTPGMTCTMPSCGLAATRTPARSWGAPPPGHPIGTYAGVCACSRRLHACTAAQAAGRASHHLTRPCRATRAATHTPLCSLAALRHELRLFLAETGLPRNRLPTASQLIDAGRGDLYKASGGGWCGAGVKWARLGATAEVVRYRLSANTAQSAPQNAPPTYHTNTDSRRRLCGEGGSMPRLGRWAGRRSGAAGRRGPTLQKWHASCGALSLPAIQGSSPRRSNGAAGPSRPGGSRWRRWRKMRMARCLRGHACRRTASWPAQGGTTSGWWRLCRNVWESRCGHC